MDHIYNVLQGNNYPAQFFQQGKPQEKTNKKPNPSTGKFIEGARAVIPYTIGLSVQYRHTLAKYRVEFSLKAPVPSNLYSCIQKIQFHMLRNWHNLPLEILIPQLHSQIHRWYQQVPERKESQTIEIKPPVPSETITSPQNTLKQNLKRFHKNKTETAIPYTIKQKKHFTFVSKIQHSTETLAK